MSAGLDETAPGRRSWNLAGLTDDQSERIHLLRMLRNTSSGVDRIMTTDGPDWLARIAAATAAPAAVAAAGGAGGELLRGPATVVVVVMLAAAFTISVLHLARRGRQRRRVAEIVEGLQLVVALKGSRAAESAVLRSGGDMAAVGRRITAAVPWRAPQRIVGPQPTR